MGPRTGLEGRKISSPPGFDPGPMYIQIYIYIYILIYIYTNKMHTSEIIFIYNNLLYISATLVVIFMEVTQTGGGGT